MPKHNLNWKISEIHYKKNPLENTIYQTFFICIHMLGHGFSIEMYL